MPCHGQCYLTQPCPRKWEVRASLRVGRYGAYLDSGSYQALSKIHVRFEGITFQQTPTL